MEFLAASSSSDAATSIVRTDSNESSGDSVLVVDNFAEENVDDDDAADEVDVVAMIPAATAAMIQTVVNKGCIECNTPSIHSCRKCKKCVCSLCCSQRELENAWWCELCFKTQSVANQQLIRDGNYDSDEDN